MENLDPGMKAAFLSRLAKATTENSVHWGAADGRPFWYWVDVEPFGYVIESTDSDDAPPFDFHVFRMRENEEPVELEVWNWQRRVANPLNNYLEAVYKAARGQVLGVANLADDLFSSLAKVDGGSPEPSAIDLSPGDPF